MLVALDAGHRAPSWCTRRRAFCSAQREDVAALTPERLQQLPGARCHLELQARSPACSGKRELVGTRAQRQLPINLPGLARPAPRAGLAVDTERLALAPARPGCWWA